MSLNGVLKCAERELGVTEFPKDSNTVIYLLIPLTSRPDGRWKHFRRNV